MVDFQAFSLNLVTKLQFFVDISNSFMQRVEEHSPKAEFKRREVFALKTF